MIEPQRDSKPPNCAGVSGQKYDYLAAIRNDKTILVYTCNGRSFALNLVNEEPDYFSCRWYNPRNGKKTDLKGVIGIQSTEFDTPGSIQLGNDWVLILELPDK